MTLNDPVLVGQRIKAVRRLTVKEQGDLGVELGWMDAPSKTGPVVIELDSGVVIVAHADGPATLWGKAGTRSAFPFEVKPSGVEVDG